MTTIAVKDGIIAYDSRSTTGSIISSDTCNKRFTKDHVHFFVAGSIADISDFAELYLAGVQKVPKGFDLHCLVWNGEQLWRVATDSNGGWFHEKMLHDFYAIGSGSHFALAAMDMGADAKTAVKMAAKRDTYTGGRIRTFALGGK